MRGRRLRSLGSSCGEVPARIAAGTGPAGQPPDEPRGVASFQFVQICLPSADELLAGGFVGSPLKLEVAAPPGQAQLLGRQRADRNDGYETGCRRRRGRCTNVWWCARRVPEPPSGKRRGGYAATQELRCRDRAGHRYQPGNGQTCEDKARPDDHASPDVVLTSHDQLLYRRTGANVPGKESLPQRRADRQPEQAPGDHQAERHHQSADGAEHEHGNGQRRPPSPYQHVSPHWHHPPGS